MHANDERSADRGSSEAVAPCKRIAWATDVHLNFLDAPAFDLFASALAEPEIDAVLLTGDIAEATSVEGFLVELARRLDRPIYFVLGNHDAYGGSLAEVRARLAHRTEGSAHLRWLVTAGVVELSRSTALVGHDGWADGRLGDYDRSPVVLNDYALIRELSGLSKGARARALAALGDDAAATLAPTLDAALSRYPRVLVATHVPPFREACWHEGRPSNDDWLPHFACKAVGDVLLRAAAAWPDRTLDVYCGHTHSGGTATLLPNLRVWTGAAEYGAPQLQGLLEVY